MSLQVEHDLQAMLDLAQETVILFQQRAFLVRQAAGVFQLCDCFQRVAGAQLRHITAVEQLQKLNHEFDVADAPLAGLHV